MNKLKNIISERNLIFAFSFIIITLIFNNFNHHQFDKFAPTQEGLYKSLSNFEFKEQINNYLVSEETYDLEKKCAVTGNMHDRHKVRWVKALFLKSLFDKSYELNTSLPYYVNIFLHSLIIFFTLIFLNKSYKLKNLHILLFLLYVSYIFQQPLAEYSYSIFEMFFLSGAIYASKNKNFLLLTILSVFAVLNRESGILTPLTWLIFNKEYKKIIICFLIVLLIFLFANFQFISCILNPKFFIPLEPQRSQVHFSNIMSINIMSLTKLLLVNFIIPFGIIFYNYYKSNTKNLIFFGLIIIYFFIFILATPLHHMSIRLILLPLIILSFYIGKEKILN